MNLGSKSYAFFDLDHTLVPHDTQLLFCNYVLQREGWRRWYLVVFLPILALGSLKIVGTKMMKRAFLSYLWLMKPRQLEDLTISFVDDIYIPEMHTEIKEEIIKHRSAKRLLVLNSASPEFYVQKIGKKLGFDCAYGTRVRVCSRRMPLIPQIEGDNNKGAVKIMRMRQILPDRTTISEGSFSDTGGDSIPDSFAYSDSHADIPLLRLAQYPVMVDPTRRLRQEGECSGWAEVRTKRGRDHWNSLLQMFGLYKKRT